MDAMRELNAYAFADNRPPAERGPPPLQPDWTLGAFAGANLAACSGAFPFTVGMNGKPMSAQGVTAVSTNPGYFRRGLVRQLITRWLEQGKETGVPLAILWASMGAIYQRFGYGLGSIDVTYSIDPAAVKFAQPRELPPGAVTLVPVDDAAATLQNLHEKFRARRTLILHRGADNWARLWRTKPTFCAIYRSPDGEPEGAVLYSTSWDGPMGPNSRQRLRIHDCCWLNPEAHQGLWQFLAAHDLVGEIVWQHVPQDEPLPLLLLEPRSLNRRTDDGLWARIIDASAALAGRGYDLPGKVTLQITGDELCPWNNDKVCLETDSIETRVTSTPHATADATLTPNALASLLCGAARATELANAGALDAANPAALDALFGTRHRPSCPDHF